MIDRILKGIGNWNSKKFGMAAVACAMVLETGAPAKYQVGAIAAIAIGYFFGDAWQNRVAKVAQGVVDATQKGGE